MSASITDKIRNNSTGIRPVSTTVSTVRSTGATSLICNDLTGWAVDTAIDFVTYKIDGQKNIVVGSQTDWKGIVSTNTINNLTVTGGSDAGNATGDIVETLPTAAWGKDLTDALRVTLEQDGTLKSSVVSGITNPILTTGKTATNLRVTPRSTSSASLTTLTPNIDTYNFYELNTQATALTIANPTGTPSDKDIVIIFLKDSGTSQAVTYGANYVNISGLDSLVATVAGKWHTIGAVYNAGLSKWLIVSITTGA